MQQHFFTIGPVQAPLIGELINQAEPQGWEHYDTVFAGQLTPPTRITVGQAIHPPVPTYMMMFARERLEGIDVDMPVFMVDGQEINPNKKG